MSARTIGRPFSLGKDSGKILLEKLEDNWEKVMAETQGSWAKHPVFGNMKNAVEIIHSPRS